MSDIRYERHLMQNPQLPFIFHTDFVYKEQSSVANWHDNTEFLYCLEGQGNVRCANEEITMQKNDIIVINARCLHSVETGNFTKYHCLIIDNKFFKDNGINIDSIKFRERINDSIAENYMNNIAQCYHENDVEYAVAKKRLYMLEFIYYLCNNYTYKEKTQGLSSTKSYTAVLNAVEYINQNFRQKLSLEQIADNSGLSRYHFARIFKENTGVTVTQHLNTTRCDYAAIMLRETRLTISEISFECGFDNPSYFAKTFRNFHGILPTEYREKYSRL